MPAPFAQRCEASFDTQSLGRGRVYFQQNRVEIVTTDDVSSTLVVGGSEVYAVSIDWSSAVIGELRASCTCPHYESGNNCKHIWASLLALDTSVDTTAVPGPHALDVCELWDDIDDATDALDDDALFDALNRLSQGSGPDSQVPAPDWLRTVESLRSAGQTTSEPLQWAGRERKHREVCYRLSIENGRDSFLVVGLFQRERTKGGDWGKIKPFILRRDRLGAIADPDERSVLDMMLAVSRSDPDLYPWYGDPEVARFVVAPPMYELVLPKLCATGRLSWVGDRRQPLEVDPPGLVWDGSEPWRFRLALDPDDSAQCWQLRARFYRHDESVMAGNGVTPLGNRLLVSAGRLARLTATDADWPWIEALASRSSPIEIPFGDRERLAELLATLPSGPQMPAASSIGAEEVYGQPRGRISIRTLQQRAASTANLYATVGFEYDSEVVSIDDDRRGFFDSDNNRIVLRDRSSEQQLSAGLGDLGLRQIPAALNGEAHAQLARRDFVDVVRGLIQHGWRVESEGFQVRRPASFSFSVSSDVDWFELSGGADFDGLAVPLPELLKAARSGKKFIELGDGSLGMLPEEWLQRYGRLAALADIDSDTLRFSSSQAMLLDALLAEQENTQVDRAFQRLRRHLHSFEGVEPRGEPKGFRGDLRGYQREGLGWLHFLKEFGFGGCLADDMGLGKTVQVLALLQSRKLRRTPKGRSSAPSIVVVPKSLVFNWLDEAERFTPELRVVNYTGTNRAEQLASFGACDLLVTTYGTLRRDITELKSHHFDYAILDESQAIKNQHSQAAKACRLLKAAHRLAMTGTPVENHLGELWSLFEFLNPGMLGSSSAFAALCKDSGKEGESLPLLARALRPFILRRTKDQVLAELPAKTEQTVRCEMPAKQRKRYNELRDYFRVQLSQQVEDLGMEKSKIHVLEALLRLRQVACHPGLVDKNLINESSAKLETLMEQLDEVLAEGHKALVFSQFTSLLTIVRDQLERRNIVYEYLDGRSRKRGDKVKRFQQDPDCPLFLISLKAGGYGLNLTAADYVFILDPWWNPAVEAQAIDRAHRLGQTRRVFAYRLICNDTVEDKILKLQSKKRELADAIVSADNSLIRGMTVEDLQMLLS